MPTEEIVCLKKALEFLPDEERSVTLERVRKWLLQNAQGWEDLASDIPAAIFRRLLSNLR